MLMAITINLEELKSNKLHESYVAQFAADIEYLLHYLYSPSLFSTPTITVTGKKTDLKTLSGLLASEKRYMDAYVKYGLGDPRVANNKIRLEKAVYNFERETGLKWPLR